MPRRAARIHNRPSSPTFEKADGSRKLQIRPELRSRWDLNEGSSGGSTFSDFIVGVSFRYGLGPARVAEVRAAEPPPADKAEIDRAIAAIKDRPADIAAEIKYEVAGQPTPSAARP